jgi:hypothetical protein
MLSIFKIIFVQNQVRKQFAIGDWALKGQVQSCYSEKVFGRNKCLT